MREHPHDERIDPLRPPASRLSHTERDAELTDAQARAAAAGRLDVLGPSGALDLQRLAGNEAVTQLLDDEQAPDDRSSPVHDVISSGGRPLDAEVRTDMEGRLGADFSDVRVHDDSAAAASASAVNAHAYTVGSDVVFQRDSYDPGSEAGRLTLAHELTHVIQQRSGPVDGAPAPGGIRVSDPGDRFEQDAAANAERVMAAPTATPSVQRDSDDDPEEDSDAAVQGLFVQRDASPDELAEDETAT